MRTKKRKKRGKTEEERKNGTRGKTEGEKNAL
jgi:hypothetical protein